MNSIEKTHKDGGGEAAEQMYVMYFIPEDVDLVNVTKDKNYQNLDIDFRLRFKTAEGLIEESTREIKGDVASFKYYRYFVEFATHIESIPKSQRELIMNYFNTAATLSLNDFYTKFGDLIPQKCRGCNYKTESDRTIFMPLKKIDEGYTDSSYLYNGYELNTKLPTLAVNTMALKQHVFTREEIYIPKNGLVYHDDGGKNLGIAVYPNTFLKYGLAYVIKPKY